MAKVNGKYISPDHMDQLKVGVHTLFQTFTLNVRVFKVKKLLQVFV